MSHLTIDRHGPSGAAATATHCPYCALQCAMTLEAPSSNPVDITVAPRDFPTNRGSLCQKGWTAASLLHHPERVTQPLMRAVPGDRTSPFVPTSWTTALDFVASRIGELQREHGHDAVAVFGGGGLTNEKAYALGKFARVALRTSQIDYNGRFCMSSAAAAGNAAFGIDRGLPFPLADVRQCGTLLLVGSNLADTMPPALQHVTAMRAAGGRLIVIDPRRTRTAEAADLHLQPAPGTDASLALGLLHIVCSLSAVDESYVAQRTSGFAEVRTSLHAHSPESVERITGVPSALLRRAAAWLAEDAPHRGGRGAMILTGRGGEQHETGTDTVLAFINVALALGLPGRPYSGYGCITGQGNGQGGREHGQKADQLPGYRSITDPVARQHVASVWGIDADSIPGPGRSAQELFAALGTDAGPRALLIMGSNPAVSAPNARLVCDRLASLDLLCVTDFVLSETAAMADVVFPTTQWAEETGTMTNLEGRVILRQAAVAPPGEARSDLAVLHGLAERLGAGVEFPADAFPEDSRAVFDELRRASAGGRADYSLITYERIRAEGGVFWGEERMFIETFPTPDGRARFHRISRREPAESVDGDFPLILTTGRLLAQYQSGAQTRRVPELVAASAEAFVEVHSTVADDLGLTNGARARIRTRRGTAIAMVRRSDSIRPDTIFMPFHWGGEGRANSLTLDVLDPTSRMPQFKACAARIEPIATAA